MTPFVRTAMGDVAPETLGRVDYHEHLFQVSPLLPGDDLDDEDAALEETRQFAASGFETMVDATPLGLGRRPAATRRIARAAGVTVVLTTGLHRREHYRDGDPLLDAGVDELAAAFEADLVAGAAEPGGERDPAVRAGVLKAGLGYWRIDAHSTRTIEAVGRAHAATGAPVMVHLEHGTAAFEALAALDAVGVAADRVALAHIDRNPDPVLHAELAATGAYLGYDGPARAREHPDAVILDCLVRAAEAGAARRILLGGDVARRTRYAAYGGIPGLRYLGERFVPRLRREGGGDLADAVLRRNPQAWLAWR
ncbi:aryldialkylphosphatase [Microbacterium sp. NPDC089188]|uniref:phosphotriesterase family protein n=1 Tax=Microbacterium sp. NPDC089188 TaxID=3154971 RepID=UPI00343FAC4A